MPCASYADATDVLNLMMPTLQKRYNELQDVSKITTTLTFNRSYSVRENMGGVVAG